MERSVCFSPRSYIFMKINCSYNELAEVDKLIPHPKNYNMHPARQIEMLAKIINYQGQRLPIVASKRSGFIISGHGRLEAIKKLGWQKAAVDWQEFANEAEEYAHMMADNKIAELAQSNDDLFEEIALSLGEGFDHELLGLKEEIVYENPQSDDAPAQAPHEEKCPECGQVI